MKYTNEWHLKNVNFGGFPLKHCMRCTTISSMLPYSFFLKKCWIQPGFSWIQLITLNGWLEHAYEPFARAAPSWVVVK